MPNTLLSSILVAWHSPTVEPTISPARVRGAEGGRQKEEGALFTKATALTGMYGYVMLKLGEFPSHMNYLF